MSKIQEIRQELMRLVTEATGGASNMICEVVSNDLSNFTTKVKIGEVEEIVRMRSVIREDKKGFVLVPAPGSKVIIERIEGSENYFISAFYEVDEVLLNGGVNGGLIKIGDLTNKINNLVDEVDNLRIKYNNHTHASHGTPTVSLVTDSFTQFNKSDYENDTFKH